MSVAKSVIVSFFSVKDCYPRCMTTIMKTIDSLSKEEHKMNLSRNKDCNCVADILRAVNESKQDTPEKLDKKNQFPKKTVTWKLIDETNPCYNRWKSSVGYVESFAKNENPNVTKPYGMSYVNKSSMEER